ncbi:hypothetical protein PHMEG_00021703 [Phytophthora megakarya]|uniref:Uncharacterized protein n=1 Tax=Phytophthora megakarya TaxID=4795 RepID=A0A225VKJ3_9STRA|nr:hypothetical protein PHMEG_00021703 [Phytophthora megakarya]
MFNLLDQSRNGYLADKRSIKPIMKVSMRLKAYYNSIRARGELVAKLLLPVGDMTQRFVQVAHKVNSSIPSQQVVVSTQNCTMDQIAVQTLELAQRTGLEQPLLKHNGVLNRSARCPRSKRTSKKKEAKF